MDEDLDLMKQTASNLTLAGEQIRPKPLISSVLVVSSSRVI